MEAPRITWDFGAGRVRPPFTVHKKPLDKGYTHVTIRSDYAARTARGHILKDAYNFAWATLPPEIDADLFAKNLLALAEIRYEMEVVNGH